MEKSSHRKHVRNASIAIFSGLTVYLLSGWLLGFGWHLLHGSAISYLGWKIPVPHNYYVTYDRGVPSIWTLSLGAPAFHLPYGRLDFHSREGAPHPFLRDRDYLKFEKSVSEAAAESGHRLKSTQITLLGGRSAYCWEFARERKQPLSLVRCATEHSNIYVFYEGDPRYLPDLYGILQGMSPDEIGK